MVGIGIEEIAVIFWVLPGFQDFFPPKKPLPAVYLQKIIQPGRAGQLVPRLLQALPDGYGIPGIDVAGARSALDRDLRAGAVQRDFAAPGDGEDVSAVFQQHHALRRRNPCQAPVFPFPRADLVCKRTGMVLGSQLHKITSFCRGFFAM